MPNVESLSEAFFCEGGDCAEHCGAYKMHRWKKAHMERITEAGGEIKNVIFSRAGHRPEGCRLGQVPNPTCPAQTDAELNRVTLLYRPPINE